MQRQACGARAVLAGLAANITHLDQLLKHRRMHTHACVGALESPLLLRKLLYVLLQLQAAGASQERM